MTSEELVNLGLTLFDEYHPQQSIDEELKTMITTFLKQYPNDYLCLLPTYCLPTSLVIDATFHQNLSIDLINYKGIAIDLTSFSPAFLRLTSFRMQGWERSVFPEEVISSNHPRRKLQDNKFTSGKTSRPVVSIENHNGKKTLCAWGYLGDNAILQDFYYIKRIDSFDDFLALDDYLLRAYIYYVLFFVFNTIQELSLAQ
ncbi:MAG: hypothetical protein Q4Q06_02925, partial [Bacteroidota bacterium]|nr:hypothetical protein [Bacteroidota bacterium]